MRMNLLKSIIKITVFAVAIHAPQAFAQQYHKWVDAKGVTHYSAKQPTGNAQSFKKRHLAKSKTTQSKFRSNSAIPDTQHHYYNNSQQAATAAVTAPPPAKTAATTTTVQKTNKTVTTATSTATKAQ